MRHFVAYHNSEKRKFSGTTITDTRARTKKGKEVGEAKGATVWLISGEGPSPKSFFLVAKFVASDCHLNAHTGTELPHEVRGRGRIFGTSRPLNGRLLEELRRESASFFRGFFELKDPAIVRALESLAR